MVKRSINLVIGAAALAVLVAATGCGDDETPVSAPGGDGAPASATDTESEDAITIAQLGWTTGPSKDLGDSILNAGELAAQEINADGGIDGRDVVVPRYDEGYAADTVVTSAKRAVSEGAVALVGGVDATTCGPLAEYAQSANTPVAITFCGSDVPLNLGYEPLVHVRKPVYSGQSDCNALRATTAWMAENYDSVQGVGVDSEFVRNTDADFARYFEEYGDGEDEYTGMLYFPYGTAEARVEVTKAVASQPDMLYLGLWGHDVVVNAIRAARDSGFEGDIMLNESVWLQPQADELGEDGHGVWGTTGWFYDPDVPESKEFHDAYVEEFGSEPDHLGAVQYTAVKLMAKAIEDAGSTEPSAIAESLPKVQVGTPDGESIRLSSEGMREADEWTLLQDREGTIEVVDSLAMCP